jgi:hypothetical protein
MRGFHVFLRQETNVSVQVVGIELKVNGLPNDATHVSGFSGEDGGFMRLNAVSQVDAVFSYG